METISHGEIKGISPLAKNELGPENTRNIQILNEKIAELTEKDGIEYHLLLVGGNVKSEKRGAYHKDVDLVLFSPQLSTEYYKGGDSKHPKFDKFADFLTEAGKQLEWSSQVEEPWFFDYEMCGGGKVTLQPKGDGKPIEILPVDESWTKLSFENYLSKNKEPYEVIK